MQYIIPILGIVIMLALAYVLCENKKAISWRPVITGIIAQLVFGFFILKTSLGLRLFSGIKEGFQSILGYSMAGAEFVFGPLANIESMGMIFACIVLPVIIFTSALMSVLYHLGIMQKVVKFFAIIMMKIMKTSGAESLAAAANVFAGQTEAPLVILPYLQKMTRSELMSLMTGGMATVAGGVLVAFVSMGFDGGHLLAASVMSAPAALALAKLMIPETQESQTAGSLKISFPKTSENVIDAAVIGAGDGLKLALNVAAMLISFIALIALCNGLLGWIGGFVGAPNLTFEMIMGYLFSPFAFLMGIPWDECLMVGNLLGKKLIFNEFVAYVDFNQLVDQLSPRTVIICTYALCGFANFASIGIQVGGIGALVPDRRRDLAQLGIKSLIAGTLACMMTACIASLFI